MTTEHTSPREPSAVIAQLRERLERQQQVEREEQREWDPDQVAWETCRSQIDACTAALALLDAQAPLIHSLWLTYDRPVDWEMHGLIASLRTLVDTMCGREGE